MAGALRPVVILMVLASALFLVDGWLDGAYPGGDGWFGGDVHQGFAWLAYLFAALNAGIALVIARGSERMLVARIALSGFFLFERPLTALALPPVSAEALVVHLLTALVELVILVGSLRVWRLGRSIEDPDLDTAFALDAPSPVRPQEYDDPRVRPSRPHSSRAIGILALALAAVLTVDGLSAGFVPGGREWGISPGDRGWIVYLFAAVVLTAALQAMRGGPLALRLLFALGLIVFLERTLTPFIVRSIDERGLALHAIGAFLALALAAAAAIRTRASTPVGVTSTSAGRA